jgi:hypothetical protein
MYFNYKYNKLESLVFFYRKSISYYKLKRELNT